MPRRPFAPIVCLLVLLASCAAPASPRVLPLGLEPPVLSPPGHLSTQERIQWWRQQLPRLSSEDRSEARLLMGELQLEVRHPVAARLAFYEAKGGRLSATELARAERGIGLSYFLEGNLLAGVSHLERALGDLEAPTAAETSYLLAAAKGEPLVALSDAVHRRMEVYLVAAKLSAPGGGHQVGDRDSDGIRLDLARADWGAAPMRSNWDRMTTPYRITVHHTAEPLASTSIAASVSEVRHIQQQHMNDKGWADLGYHFLIDRAGRVVEGRPLFAQGAHAGENQNEGNIGISLLGNFVADPARGVDYRHAQAPTVAQMESLDRLVAEVRARYGIPADQVWGHSKWNDTLCPGPHLLAWANRYRMSVGKP